MTPEEGGADPLEGRLATGRARPLRQLPRACALHALAALVAVLFRVWTSSCGRRRSSRHGVRTVGRPLTGLYLFAHSAVLLALLEGRDRRDGASLVSLHGDGELASHLAAWLGLHVIRGSSNRRRVQALRQVQNWIDSDRPLAVALDGPRGPRFRSKPGLIESASQHQWPVFLMAMVPAGFIELPSWDRLRIPLPFTRIWIDVARLETPYDPSAVDLKLLEMVNALECRAGLDPRDWSSRAAEGETGRVPGARLRVVRPAKG